MTTIRKHKSDLVILFCTLGLMAVGLIVIYAIGPMRANVLNNAYNADYGANDFFFGQLRSVALALVAFFLAFKIIPYKYIKKIARPLMYFAIAASVLLWIASLAHLPIAKCELGECRWFAIGSLSVQPAELLKLAMVIYLADFLVRARQTDTIGKFKEFWLPLLIICGSSLFLVVVAQGDLGTGVALMAIILGMLFASGLSAKQYLIMLAVILVVAVGAVATSSHRMERIDAWLATIQGSESDSTYHIENAMLAIGTGGLFGVGIGNSVQATGYLPESINDSVFAIMGETFGLLGLVAIITVFVIILWRMLRVASSSPDAEDSFLVVGVFSWMLAQVVVNIMAMTGLVPVTGITLPLLSYGGTSMIFIAFAIGLVLQISCYTSREGTNQNIERVLPPTSSRRTRHSSRGNQ